MAEVNGSDARAQRAQQRSDRLRGVAKETLAETIKELDRQCAEYAERIEALAHGADALLATEARALSPWRSQKLAKLLEMIGDTSAELANAVNCDAEQVGCNHIEEVDHA